MGQGDYIPQLQPFSPNLNYYASVLSTKQNQYDQGLAKLNSIYGTALNSPLLGQDNIERRNKYFETIETDIKKAAGTDLSIDQNVQNASQIFQPILNDKDILNDMIYTKGVHNAVKTGERYRYCSDPSKCGGEFWEPGMQEINYRVEEFQKATPEERLRMKAPEFTPFQNVTKMAVKAAKDAGFNVVNEYNNGGYDYTDTNGYLLLNKKDKDGKIIQGVLPQYLYGVFGNDSTIQKMYDTQAYVTRKSYSKANAARFGGDENAAEREYINQVLPKAIQDLTKSSENLNELRGRAEVDKEVLETGDVPGPDTETAYEKITRLLANTEGAKTKHEEVAGLIKTTSNIDDIEALRSRADQIMSNSFLSNTLDAAAYEYAMGTAKHDMKVDPYKFESFKAGLDISKAKQLKDYDDAIWTKQQLLLGNIGGTLGSGGINQEQYEALSKIPEDVLRDNGIFKLDKKGIELAQKKGLLAPATTDKAGNFVILPANDPFENVHYEQSKVVHEAAASAFAKSDKFIKAQVNAMKESFKNADAIFGADKALGYKAKIMVDAEALVGASAGAIMRGELEFKPDPNKVPSMTKKAMDIRQRNVAARIYNDGYSDTELLDVQMATKAADDFYKLRGSELKSSINTALTDNLSFYRKGQSPIGESQITIKYDEADYQKKAALINSIANKNTGEMIDPSQARALYIKHASGFFGGNDKINSAEEDSYRSHANQSAAVEAAKYFDKNYGPELKIINSRLTTFKGEASDNTTGGASLAKNSVSKNYDGNKPLAPNSLLISNIVKDIANNPDGKSIVFTNINPQTGLTGLGVNANDPSKQELFQKVADRIRTQDIKDLNIQTELLYVPPTFNRDSFSEDEAVNAIYTNPGNMRALPGTTTDPSVFIKMTIPENTYRSLNHVKNDDKVSLSDRTIVVKTTSGESGKFINSLTPFIEGIKDTPEEIYLSKVGRSISFDLGANKGTGLIQRVKDGDNTKLQTSITVPIFDSKTGLWGSGTMNYAVDSPNIEDIQKVISSQVNEINLANKKAAYDYARSDKSK